MIHKTTKYSNFRTLKQFIRDNRIDQYQNILIQIFCGLNNRAGIKKLTRGLKNILPQACLIGTSAGLEIIDGQLVQKGVVISFSCFDAVTVRTHIISNQSLDMYEMGVELAAKLVKEDTKALLVFCHGNYNNENFNTHKLMAGISSVNKEVIVAGGAASSPTTGEQDVQKFLQYEMNSFIFDEKEMYPDTIVAASLSGKKLHVTTGCNLGWKTIGKKMEVTRVEPFGQVSRVYTIDNLPAREIYRKYFGDEVADNLPQSALLFSFILERNGMEIDASPMQVFDDDSIIFTFKIKQGDMLQFGFGDPGIVLHEALASASKLARQSQEAIYIYSCITRPMLLSHFTKNELIPFKEIAPSCGFFTMNEFFHVNGHNLPVGKTMTILALTENESSPPASREMNISSGLKDKSFIDSVMGIYNMVQRMTFEVQEEQKKSEALLLNILPESTATRLKDGVHTIADHLDDVSILFADIVGFTRMTTREKPESLINILHEIFSQFDRLADQFNLEKIKTIGDAYFLAGGVPDYREDHLFSIVSYARQMIDLVKVFSRENDRQLNIRVGIHTGPVIAGVLGTRKFSYDLWGDTVNIASRMESHGLPGRVQVSEYVYERLKDQFSFTRRGTIELKGRGKMLVYLVD